MDLSAFTEPILAREFVEGRPANDPRVMVGLWLWAAVNNVARGRVLARLCERDLTFKWMCGDLSMNYHTLNDFRVGHQAALDRLFTAVLGKLAHAGLVGVHRISQDGLRVRARLRRAQSSRAGAGCLHTRPTLERCLAEAGAHLADLKRMAESLENQEVEQLDNALQSALAEDRLTRVKAALVEVARVERSKARQHGPKAGRPAWASTTDPEARNMKIPNSGFNPAYNVQFASDPVSRAIMGVMVSNSGADFVLSEPMRKQVKDRTGRKVSEHLVDGGYVNHGSIDNAAAAEVTLYMPVPKPSANAKEQDRHAPRDDDSEAVARWRARMNAGEAREICRQCAATARLSSPKSSKTINADT